MRYFICLIFCIICNLSCFSQERINIDSIVNLHQEYFTKIKEAEENDRHQEAILYGIKDAELLKDYCGENNNLYLDAMIFLSYLYYGSKEYEHALNTIATAVTISKQYLPETLEIYIKALNHQMRLCYGTKHYDACIESAMTKLDNMINHIIPSDESVLETIDFLGRCYKEKGEYLRAIEFFNLFLNDSQNLQNNIETKVKISDCYALIGDNKKAIQFIEEAFKMLKDTDYSDVALSIQLCLELSKHYFNILDISNAIKWIKRAEEVHRYYNQNKKDDIYAEICIMKSIILLSGGDAQLALPLTEEACLILDNEYGKDSRQYTDALSLLSLLYAHNNETHKAVELAELSHKYIELSDSANYFVNVIRDENNLCHAYYMDKQYDKMVKSAHLYINNLSYLIYNRFMLSNETQRKTIWKMEKSSESLCYPLYKEVRKAMRNNDDLSKCLYDLALVSKGLLLTSEKYYNEVLFQKGYDHNNDISSLEIRKDLQLNPQLHNALNITWESVRSFLDTQDIAVEFIESPDSFVIALIIRKGWNAPKIVEVCHLNQLILFQDNINQTYTSTKLGQLIWNNILQISGASKGDYIYFSIDGQLSLLNIESVLLANNTYISDIYQLRRISSTRDIPNVKDNQTINLNNCHFSLYGGIDYNSKTLSSNYQKNENYDDCFFAYQLKDSLTIQQRGSFIYLPGTKKETDSIKNLLIKNNIKEEQILLYQNTEATEESFKQLSFQEPEILHLATHGYYIKPTKEELYAGQMSEFKKKLFKDTIKDIDLIDYGLSRTGLLFAGANKATENRNETEFEDGFLTSKEISQLNLSSVEMVILPVCLSAAGSVTFDGISGLQRGFKIAGAKTMLMSLWGIDDEATALMMISFYKALLQSGSKYDAFRKAQSVVKETYCEPYYWASFILLD